MERSIPVLGLAVIVGIGWLLSDRRRAIDWRIVGWGLGLQLLFGWFALKTAAGRGSFDWLGARVNGLLDYSQEGARFVFGNLVDNPSIGFVFALKVLPTIVFFSAFMSVLYHLRLLQVVVRGIGLAMRNLMRVSGAEAFSAAANIFVGQTEAPFVIKPFLARMTSSEVFCVMTGGFATVAGGVMAAYIFMFKDHPTFGKDIAAHLIAASVMSAPAAIVLSKVMRPETGEPVTRGNVRIEMERPSRNVIDAAVTGARDGLLLAANVAAMLVAFIGLIASIAIQVGGIGAMVPEQRETLARHGLPAMVAGTLACFMTACVAAILL